MSYHAEYEASGKWVGSLKVDPRQPQMSPELADFCKVRGVMADVDRLVSLVRETFDSVRKLDLQLTADPESGEKQIVVWVCVGCDIDRALDSYNQCVKKWVGSSEWIARDVIRLSYDVVCP